MVGIGDPADPESKGNAMNLAEFQMTKNGAIIGEILTKDTSLLAMIAKCEAQRPAAEAIGTHIEDAVGTLTDHEKKLVGRWIKQLIAPHGWEPDRKGRVAKGHFFNRGTIYRRTSRPAPLAADSAKNVRRAQKLAAALPYPIPSVDDFIAARRMASVAE